MKKEIDELKAAMVSWVYPKNKNPSSTHNDNELMKTESNNTSKQSIPSDYNIMDCDGEYSEHSEKVNENLAQLMTKVIPDADVECSNVIVIGAQSCGKTKLINSMIFQHLVDNPSFTDEMGDILLKLSSTGKNMITRRPIEINFMKSVTSNISLQLGNNRSNFNEPGFDQIINQVRSESIQQNGKAYMEKLIITIFACNLPHMKFTDLPGLITEDCELSDAKGLTIRALVEQYMRTPNTTIIAVEPASNEELATSLVVPLISRLKKDGCLDIFSNTVLVLSKCDKIREGLEQPIMDLVERTAEIHDYPFKHVVGVINKIKPERASTDMDTEPLSELPDSFSQYKKMFQATKLHEKKRFSAYKTQDKAPCCTTTQCTTAAVFHHMEIITFQQVRQSMALGLQSLASKVDATKDIIRAECAPHLSYYDNITSSTSSNSNSGDTKVHSNRLVFIRDLRTTLKTLVNEKFKSMSLFCDNSMNTLLYNNNIIWPTKFHFKDCEIYHKQVDALKGIDQLLCEFIDSKVYNAVIHLLEDPKMGCFASKHSSFHRIERFPHLIDALKSKLHSVFAKCCVAAKTAMQTNLGYWKFEVCRGKVSLDNLPSMLAHLESIALCEFSENLCVLIQDQAFDQLVEDDYLMEENANFVEARNILRLRWENLRGQETILQQCYEVQDNNALCGVLETACSTLQNSSGGIADSEWLQFWQDAEYSASSLIAQGHDAPHSAPMDEGHDTQQSQSMDEGLSDNSLLDPSMILKKSRASHGVSSSTSKYKGKRALSQKPNLMVPCHPANLVTPSAQELPLAPYSSLSPSSSSSSSSSDSAIPIDADTKKLPMEDNFSPSQSSISTPESAIPRGPGSKYPILRAQDSSSRSMSSIATPAPALGRGIGSTHKRTSDCLSNSGTDGATTTAAKKKGQVVDLTWESEQEDSDDEG